MNIITLRGNHCKLTVFKFCIRRKRLNFLKIHILLKKLITSIYVDIQWSRIKKCEILKFRVILRSQKIRIIIY